MLFNSLLLGFAFVAGQTLMRIESDKPHKVFSVEDISADNSAAAAADGSAIARPNQRWPWTDEEECAIIGGVSRYCQGMWTFILSSAQFGPVLRGRTNVNLKDKYRNMCKSGDLTAL